MKYSLQNDLEIDFRDRCAQNADAWAKKTFCHREYKSGMSCQNVDGTFSNMLDFYGTRLGIASAGIGTKSELAERTGNYLTMGWDLMAMAVDKLAATGFEPTNIAYILHVDVLDYDIINDLMHGLYDAAKKAGVAISDGKIVESGSRISGYGDRMHFNWGATVIGVLHTNLEHPIDGSDVRPGDIIISLKSRGLQGNGFSLVSKTMIEHIGEAWHTARYDDMSTWGEVLLTPSSIFAPVLGRLLDAGIHLKGIAHTIENGIEDNLKRVLNVNGLGASLNNLFEPPAMVKKICELGQIPLETAYNFWNMGNGMLIIVDKTTIGPALLLMNKNDYEAVAAGEVTAEPRINIHY